MEHRNVCNQAVALEGVDGTFLVVYFENMLLPNQALSKRWLKLLCGLCGWASSLPCLQHERESYQRNFDSVSL